MITNKYNPEIYEVFIKIEDINSINLATLDI